MRTAIYIISALLFLNNCYSQDGDSDLSFGVDGVIFQDYLNGEEFPMSVVQQSDGKLIAVISYYYNFGAGKFLLARYLEDGSLDTTFGDNGFVQTNLNNNSNVFLDAKVTEEDEILVLGEVHGAGFARNFIILKYLSEGELDINFGDGGYKEISVSTDYSKQLHLLSDGTILIVGSTQYASNTYRLVLIKLDNGGEFESSFGNQGIVEYEVINNYFSVETSFVQNDHKILIGGRTSSANQNQIYTARFLENGDIDPSFGSNSNGIVFDTFTDSHHNYTLSVNIDNKIVGVVSRFNYDLETSSTYLYRLLENGERDVSLNETGIKYIGGFAANHLIIQQNNRLLISGIIPDFFEASEFLIRRYFYDGSIDYSFSGVIFNFEGSSMTLQDDGKVIGFGNTYWFEGAIDMALFRLHNNPLSIIDFESKEINIFPNPSEGNFKLEISPLFLETNYEVTDKLGRKILTGTFSSIKTTIDLSTKSVGVYYLITQFKTFKLLRK